MKNPWLSMWLSAANSAAGAARGFWTAEMRRQQNAVIREVGRSSVAGYASAPKKRPASSVGRKLAVVPQRVLAATCARSVSGSVPGRDHD